MEDDQHLRDGLIIALSEKNELSAIGASSLAQAKTLLTNHTFDLMVLDINLPDGNGLGFCQQVRASSNIPIIF